MTLNEISKELTRELERFIWTKPLVPRIVNVVIPLFARNYVPEFVWQVEQYIEEDEGIGFGEVCYVTTSLAKIGDLFRRDELISIYDSSLGRFCFAVTRYQTNSVAPNPTLVDVYDAMGCKVSRQAGESDEAYLWRAIERVNLQESEEAIS